MPTQLPCQYSHKGFPYGRICTMWGSSHGLASPCSSSSLATRYLLMLTDLHSPAGFPHRPLKQRSQSCKHETSTCQVRIYRWDDRVSQLQTIPESWNSNILLPICGPSGRWTSDVFKEPYLLLGMVPERWDWLRRCALRLLHSASILSLIHI